MPFYFLNYPRWFREAEATVVIQCHVRRFIATPWERRQVLRDLRYKLKRWAYSVRLMILSYDRLRLLPVTHKINGANMLALIKRDQVIRRAQEAIGLDQKRILLFFEQLPDDVKHHVVSFCPHLVKLPLPLRRNCRLGPAKIIISEDDDDDDDDRLLETLLSATPASSTIPVGSLADLMRGQRTGLINHINFDEGSTLRHFGLSSDVGGDGAAV